MFAKMPMAKQSVYMRNGLICGEGRAVWRKTGIWLRCSLAFPSDVVHYVAMSNSIAACGGGCGGSLSGSDCLTEPAPTGCACLAATHLLD